MAQEGSGLQHQPFETQVSRIGRQGLQLNKPLDQLSPDELSRMANLYTTGADLVTRLGQTALATAVGSIHSIRRLNDPQHSTYTRFWGAGAVWYRGQSGVLSSLEVGFSGNPLTLVPVRPPFSGESWMLVADSLKMRKASRTSASLPIGLPVPAGLTTAISEIDTTRIATFDTSDGTQASAWTGFGGYDTLQTGIGDVPFIGDVPGLSGSAVALLTNPGNATAGYLSMMALPKVLDLSKLQGGTVAATDDDIIHLWLRINIPSTVTEVRLYLVCSPFSATWDIPGTNPTVNTAAYMRAYRPSDYAGYVATLVTADVAASAAGQAALLRRPWLTGNEDPTPDLNTGTDPASTGLVGAGTWTEYGRIGLPVRRSDFIKIGTAGEPGTDWSTITGVYITVQTATAGTAATVSFDDCFLIGGAGPDTTEAGASKLDYKVVNYDPRTGARSNGTPTQADTLWLDSLRSPIVITPAAYGDAAMRQEAYRRGGSLVDNWYFVGQNTSDGGQIIDRFADADILNSDVVPVDHFQPVATVDAAGNTVLNQPVPVVFGPFDDGTICALGDPYRPGFLYACISGQPDHWPSTGAFAVEVCSPSEQLMNGCVWGGQGFVLSRERGYAVHTNIAGGDGIGTTPTACKPGLAARWGFCDGAGGIFYVSRDGIRVTQGGISEILDDALWPLFHGQAVNGYAPIDFSVEAAIRLSIHDTDLWFLFQDTNGARQSFIYSLAYRYWRTYGFARAVVVAYSDEDTNENTGTGTLRLLQGSTNAAAYQHSGFTDDGVAIGYLCRTGAWDFGRPREEKLAGDLILDADLQGTVVTVQTLLNVETVTNNAQTATGTAGRKRYTFDPFGTAPQHVRNLSVDISGGAPATAQVTLSQLGISWASQPDVTMNRVTQWQSLNDLGENYLKGCWIDSDTGGTARTIYVEGLLNGTTVAVATLTVTSAAGRRQWFSWNAVHMDMVRLRPAGDCQPWILFGQGWLSDAEPPRIAVWDTNFETLGDSYYTGVDIEVNTFGVTKTLAFQVDGTTIETLTVNTATRQFVHFTLGPGRGHIYRISATDANLGLFYAHKWITEAEPGEQANWNQGYDDLKDPGAKYLTGLILEVDTFNQPKTVTIEIDGVVQETHTVTANGRQTVSVGFTSGPYRGYVVRVLPTDSNPGRLYAKHWLYSKEPEYTATAELENFDDLGDPGDKYITGILLECRTAGLNKLVQVEIDGSVVETLTINNPERRTSNFNFAGGPYFGKVVRLLMTADTVPIQIWTKKWLFDKEPDNTAGFAVQNWSVLGTRADKYVKGVILEVETFGQPKTLTIEADGVVIETLTVQTTGRKVLQFTFPQVLARVLRLRATDTNPGKLYSTQWIFDEEPLDLARWETQLMDFDLPGSGWGSILSADVCYKTSTSCTLTIQVYNSQGALVQTLINALPSTGGAKQKAFVPVTYNKGVLFKLLFTTDDLSAGMTLYQEESRLKIKPWDASESLLKPFGNDDLGVTRNMRVATVAAARSGGGS